MKQHKFMSQQYNKALFTLSYLVSLQLRKYMQTLDSLTKMRREDMLDKDIWEQKQAQISKSLSKF